MPIVNISTKGKFHRKLGSLRCACQQIVPAGLNSAEMPLSPGCIIFKCSGSVDSDSPTDVLVEIKAYHSNDRQENIEERALSIRRALSNLFRPFTFTVWIDLTISGYSSDVSDKEMDVDMSMEAAIERFKCTLDAT